MFRYLKRRKQKPRDPIPGWVKWAVLAFIAYAVITNPNRGKLSEHTAQTTKPTADVIGVASERLSQYKSALGSLGIALRVEDVTTGTGHPLLCGQEIALAYEALYENGKPVGDGATKDKPYLFHIGAGKAMPALEQGVVGMSVGGKRSIFARNSLAYGDSREGIAKDATLRFNVEVLSATPDLSKLDSTAFRIFDAAPGHGNAVMCGQPVHVMVKVWSVEGKKLFETKTPILFTPGKSEVALGLEQGILGMGRGGVRTLIIPPSLQKPMQGGKPAQSLALPQAQTVIMDVAVN
jgi:peptidylprolyl isomerase